MRPVGEEKGEDAHVQATLVQKVHVTDGGRPNGRRRASTNAVKHAGCDDPRPGGTVSRSNVCHGRHKVAADVDGPPTVHVGQGHGEQWTYACKDDIDGQLVGSLDHSDVKFLAEWHEGWVDNCARHRSQERKPADLQEDE